jgi:biotin operon repressor
VTRGDFCGLILTMRIWYNYYREVERRIFMESKKRNPKKTVILYVLNVIKVYASEENPVSQTAICKYLNDINIACDRKTVGRNISYLKEFGYPIEKINGKGYYIHKEKLESIKEKNKIIV